MDFWDCLGQMLRCLETMLWMNIQIPDDLVRGLEGIAVLRNMSVEQLAIERLRASFERRSSPQAILESIRALRHPTPSAVDDLEAVIAAGLLPVRDQGLFDK